MAEALEGRWDRKIWMQMHPGEHRSPYVRLAL